MNYKLARVVKGASGFYVTYSFKDPSTGKYKVYKLRKSWDEIGNEFDINRADSVKEKKALANQLAFEINELLKNGYNPFGNTQENPTLKDAITEAFDSKKAKGIGQKSILAYRKTIEYINKYIKKVYVNELNSSDFEMWCNCLTQKKGLTNRTRDNYLINIKSLFNEMVLLGLIKQSPIKVKRLTNQKQPSQTKHLALTPEEIDAILPVLKQKNYNLYLMARLVYFCLIRPKEGRYLKVKHFNLKEGILTVPGDITKTGKAKHPILPNVLKDDLQEVLKANKEFYVFSNLSKPGVNLLNHNYFSKNWKIIVKDGLGIQKDLYGLKRSGIYAILNDYDIELARYQADHADISTTGIYAKHKKGLMDKFRNEFK